MKGKRTFMGLLITVIILLIAAIGIWLIPSEEEKPVMTISEITNTELVTKGKTIQDVLSTFYTDIYMLLESDNPSIIEVTTPGIQLSNIAGIRSLLGKCNIETAAALQQCSDLSTALSEGNYIMSFTVNTNEGTFCLFTYLWLTPIDNIYTITLNSYEIVPW